jgi:hypothetical protein
MSLPRNPSSIDISIYCSDDYSASAGISEVVDNICHFYPPFDHLDYVRISRIYRRKFIEHFLAL